MTGSAAGVETGRGAAVGNAAAAETNEEVAAESGAAAERGGDATETTTNSELLPASCSHRKWACHGVVCCPQTQTKAASSPLKLQSHFPHMRLHPSTMDTWREDTHLSHSLRLSVSCWLFTLKPVKIVVFLFPVGGGPRVRLQSGRRRVQSRGRRVQSGEIITPHHCMIPERDE